VGGRGDVRRPTPAGLAQPPRSASAGLAKRAEYGRILRWYAGALDYRRVRWFCARPATRQRLADLVEQERMADVVDVEALPEGVVPTGWG
jgi:hypothetical protein